jgi:DNA-binding HxlR family transcriptional regulator
MMKSKDPLDKSQEFDEIIAILTAIGHPNRFKILILLLKGPLTFQRLLNEMNLKKSALANHLTHLKDKSLVEKVQHGTYKITDDGRNYIRVIEVAYRESEARKKKIGEIKQRQELAKTFLDRR